MHKPRPNRNSIAPPQFMIFLIVLLVAGAVSIRAMSDMMLGIMVGFDVAAALFLLACITLLITRDAEQIRNHAITYDANRPLLLGITVTVIFVLFIAIYAETVGNRPQPLTKGLVILTLALAWLFSNGVYALHYAHLAYSNEHGDLGLDFPDTPKPAYWDFVYFAFTLGMTFQTSDVTIRSGRIRRIATLHCFEAFMFNIGVLAFTINVIGGN